MFGRIRTTPSSLESLEGSPSKILKDDSFSIYEATLMKLKLGAQLDTTASSAEVNEIVDHSSIGSTNMKSDCGSASVASPLCSGQIIITSSPGDDEMMAMDMDMDADCTSVTASPGFSSHVSGGNSQQPRQSDVSILRFFKFKDAGCAGASSCGEPSSIKNDSSGYVSSTSIECHSTSEMESIQSFQDSKLLEQMVTLHDSEAAAIFSKKFV